jgi:tetratricopeptide (TPR) repeat protein
MEKQRNRQPATNSWQFPVGCVLVIIATWIAYRPSLSHYFLWDDDRHVTSPDMLDLESLGRMWWDLGSTQQYYPLLHSTFWLEHKVFGYDALGYRLVNFGLHLIVVWLVYRVLIRLKIPGAFLAAAIFALHPVHVETVAWVSEQKNTLSAIFYLSAAIAYLKFDETRLPSYWWQALVAFVAALLTKSVTATLPAAILVVFWWQRGELTWQRDVRPLTPFFCLGIVSGLFTAWVELRYIGADDPMFFVPYSERLLLVGRTPWFYLSKLLWPQNLSFIYERWRLDPRVIWQWLFPVATLGLLAVLWFVREYSRAPLAAILFFGMTLFPALGFFNVYPFRFSYVADHFQYLASLGIIAIAASAVWIYAGKYRTVVAAVLLMALTAVSWNTTPKYKYNRVLYQATIRDNPRCWMALHNLAGFYVTEGRVLEAIELERRALEAHPDHNRSHENLGQQLIKVGKVDEGLSHLRTAIGIDAEDWHAPYSLGIQLRLLKRFDEAAAALQDSRELAIKHGHSTKDVDRQIEKLQNDMASTE